MKRFLPLLVVLGGIFIPPAMAQNCASSSKLACLIPNELNTVNPNSNTTDFQLIGEAVGSAVSDLPLASPASGVIYVTDPKLNLPVPSNATLGPVLVQRSETIGHHKLFVAFTYQRFEFSDIDGISLKKVPVYLPNQNGTEVAVTNNRIDLKASQFAGYFTFGLTSRIDISVAVPVVDVHERITSSGLIDVFSSGTQAFSNTSAADGATGIGDVTLAVKYTVWKPSHGGFAVGSEFRLPSGDALNFLGAGAYGFRPFGTLTWGGRISPHANIAYEANTNTVLLTNSSGGHGQLPNRLIYSGGADWGATHWLTFAADVLAQHVFDGPRVQLENFALQNANNVYQTIAPFSGSYNRTDGSVGIKVKPVRNLILTGNLIVKMDQGGLRSRLAPLFGASYTF